MKYLKEILALSILALVINGCISKTREPVNSYKSNFCGWAVPFSSLQEPFDETASDAMINLIYRYDIEFDCICNNNQVSCNQKK